MFFDALDLLWELDSSWCKVVNVLWLAPTGLETVDFFVQFFSRRTVMTNSRMTLRKVSVRREFFLNVCPETGEGTGTLNPHTRITPWEAKAPLAHEEPEEWIPSLQYQEEVSKPTDSCSKFQTNHRGRNLRGLGGPVVARAHSLKSVDLFQVIRDSENGARVKRSTPTTPTPTPSPGGGEGPSPPGLRVQQP
jgi:hypothetical protein